MNVTIKLDDNLVAEARQEAVKSGLSLSGWFAMLTRHELGLRKSKQKRTLFDALGSDQVYDHNFEFDRV